MADNVTTMQPAYEDRCGEEVAYSWTTKTGENRALEVNTYNKMLVSVNMIEGIVIAIPNPFTLAAIVQSRLVYKTATNIFIASLCLTDLLSGVAMISTNLLIIISWEGIQSPPVGIFSWCTALLGSITFLSSLLTVLLIGVDRACACISPMTYRKKMSTRNAVVLLAAMWASIFMIIVVPVCYKYGTISQEDRFRVIEHPTTVFPDGYMAICYYTSGIHCPMYNHHSLPWRIQSIRTLCKEGPFFEQDKY